MRRQAVFPEFGALHPAWRRTCAAPLRPEIYNSDLLRDCGALEISKIYF